LELDLATSATSRANIVEAARAGMLLPEGWAQDSQGTPTRDPNAALAGSLLAFGGDKGFGLLVALEAITGVLAGGAFADQVANKEMSKNAPEGTSFALIAIDLDQAIGSKTYTRRLAAMLDRLHRLPTGGNREPPRYPGERRWSLRRNRLATASASFGGADLITGKKSWALQFNEDVPKSMASGRCGRTINQLSAYRRAQGYAIW
jgi:LDH2 family malate/lactate/ureidoglycolate dehydrogenase